MLIDSNNVSHNTAFQFTVPTSVGNDTVKQEIVIAQLIEHFDTYNYDQYKYFPSKVRDGWKGFLEKRIRDSFANPESENFYLMTNGLPFFVSFKVSSWDESTFGFKIANSNLQFFPESEISQNSVRDLLHYCLNVLRGKNVKFVNIRIHGDNLDGIHAVEDCGFKYFETIVWPFSESRKMLVEGVDVAYRLMSDNDLPFVQSIASKHQYSRGHYYCDKRFDKESINKMHVKWLNSYWQQNKPIMVILYKDTIAGYIVLRGVDNNMFKYFGLKVGQLSSMALDPVYRGIGLGKNLIKGGISMLHDMGVDYVDTGLATKNLFSSASIRVADFRNYYEEVTFHLWL